ncbi:MAG: MotA/TolQ/ExbB proton channel family protein [Candidatus Omnitrophica bacterium]|nr:MotA/TolQ/ExbB proton channel family protein [Candidatus Omnitrophota bacterium]
MGNKWKLYLMVVIIVLFASGAVFASGGIEKYIPGSDSGMTLWQVIKSGGEIMIVLALMSIALLALVIYCFITISTEKLLPSAFKGNIITLMESGKYDEARIMCEGKNNLVAEMVTIGLAKQPEGIRAADEAMEDAMKKKISTLWQRLSYLSDIASISPMVGLLGTVLGMIQAFNVIAFQTGAVKPILLASGISKAMITTAGGLILAIPAMIFYAYFRGVVETISSGVEHVSNEILKLVTQRKK